MPFSSELDVLSTFSVEIWNQSPKIYLQTKFELDPMKTGKIIEFSEGDASHKNIMMTS